jgi:hypothetical protein
MELEQLVRHAFRFKESERLPPELLDYCTFEGSIAVKTGDYHFLSYWTTPEHIQRKHLIVVAVVYEDSVVFYDRLLFDVSNDSIPVLQKIADLCKIRSEVDELMKKIGYPDSSH